MLKYVNMYIFALKELFNFHEKSRHKALNKNTVCMSPVSHCWTVCHLGPASHDMSLAGVSLALVRISGMC